MRQLNFDLKLLQDRHREGGFVTRRDRSYVLARAANTLHELGFRRLRAGLRRKHVDALVREWRGQGLSTGTLKIRMAHLRWWARRGVVGTNVEHGIGHRPGSARRRPPDGGPRRVHLYLLLEKQVGGRRASRRRLEG